MSARLFAPSRLLLRLAAACFGISGVAQGQMPPVPHEPEIKPNMSTDPVLRSFSFRSIGPAVFGGRVDDIQGSAKDAMLLYVGFATGGLWKSTDGGNHWKSQFDMAENESIGAIGIAPSDPNIVYVGKGEANGRQSSSIGDGVWGTRDGGKTWTYLGLEKVQSINRVVVDPWNPNIVYVAAPGHLFGPNPDRGLYKTTDGGKTWKNMKFIDNDTGFNDVVLDPLDSKIVYATSFARRRNGWGYNGGSANCALWKSVNGGETWIKLDGPGWPRPKDGLYGRIALAIFPAKPGTLYALVEAGASALPDRGTLASVGGPAPNTAPDPNGSGVFRSDDGGKTWKFMSDQNHRPGYFSQIRVDPKNVDKVMVGGTPGQMSLDGGTTWKGFTASHVDYHAIWINPADPRVVAIGHDGGFDISNDGGFTWDYHNDLAVGQFYQISADNRHPYHVCGGLQDNAAWCGPSALRSTTGPMNSDWYSVAGGDGYYTRQDPIDWAIVYAEGGDMLRHNLRDGTQKIIIPTLPPAILPRAAAAPAEGTLAPAEGAAAGQAAGTVSDTAPGTAAGETAAGSPANGLGPQASGNIGNVTKDIQPLRFYWQAPFEVSPHNPAVLYVASQYVFKSTDQGDTWMITSTQDLSKNLPRGSANRSIMGVPDDKLMVSKNDNSSAVSVATQMRESPSKPGILWVGTDDGNLQVSQDDGKTWTNVYANLPGAPQGYIQVSRIEPSRFDPGTAYVAIDAHREDDWAPYLYKTTDYGKTFTNITANLPSNGNINALREDPVNPDLLFVGTEFGMFVSMDGAKSWQRFMNGMPAVRVDDILIHPRDHDLIVGTHGRSIWIMDDITSLEQMKEAKNKDVFLFEPRPAILWKNKLADQRHGANRVVGSNREFIGANPEGGTAIAIYSKTDAGKTKVEFLQGARVVSTMDVDVKAGLNRFQWNMCGPPPAAAAGDRGLAGSPWMNGVTHCPWCNESLPTDPNAPPPPPAGYPESWYPESTKVPFIAGVDEVSALSTGRAPQGPILAPGSYMIRVIVGGQTLTSSIDVIEDVWVGMQ